MGIGTEQGQQHHGLAQSPHRALELLPQDWLKISCEILHQSSEKKKIHQSSDLSLLDWTIYKKAYDLINESLARGKTQINWGGDHSVGLATVAAYLSQFSDGYVLWIDAHADLNTPESSLTGYFHGMPLSHLMGVNQSFLNRKFPFWGVLEPKKLIYVGLRDLDPYEKYLIRKLGIKAYYCEELHSNQFTKTLFEIETILSNKPIHVSFDIDSVDPSIAASTGVCSPQGIQLDQLRALASMLNMKKNVKSVDVVEINPEIGSKQEVLNTYAIAFEFLNILLNLNGESKNGTIYKSNKNNISLPKKWDLLLFP